ncbi:molybdate metabolism transcriptional regulator [Pandoraea thiooxydans]|uniref:LysR family transcriptional regulator n=2 Tax=Pandoraea thiooxydans TaxID=445709 RepID=A0A0G3EU37_9BURK|nr:molybdate metabolism transcriptional regulator [Pandoraea thiooxydans]
MKHMKRLAIYPQLRLRLAEGEQSLERLVALLESVESHGNLQAASQQLGLSYRGAWGHLKDAEHAFGVPLLETARGRGAQLTEFSRRLIWGEKRLLARLGPLLETMASELQHELDEAVADLSPQLRVFASHGMAVAALAEFAARTEVPLDISYRGSMEAVAALARGECEMASFHMPLGEFAKPVLAHYASLIRGKSYMLADVASRSLGLIVARGNPHGIRSFNDLPGSALRFANRERGSGTRIIFDLLLAKTGHGPASIHGVETVELTHAAVAAYIASGKADAGLGIEASAAQFDLDFLPILTERYSLIFPADAMDNPSVAALLAIMQSAAYQKAVAAIPGYSCSDTGKVTLLADLFPELAV